MTTRLADDFDAIGERLRELRTERDQPAGDDPLFEIVEVCTCPHTVEGLAILTAACPAHGFLRTADRKGDSS